MQDIILIAHNIRSTHNVGSIFRSAECFGVSKLILSGYTPYPTLPDDTRLPHISKRMTDQIHKTALGTELIVPFEYHEQPPLEIVSSEGYAIVALEQNSSSIQIDAYAAGPKTALLLGEERHGITTDLLEKVDSIVEIPMLGTKESLNVSVATGIALYQLRQR
jgi:23S rRNA (guanosine2251-2'-O)-methyltransferase